jgi:hypothetical protein
MSVHQQAGEIACSFLTFFAGYNMAVGLLSWIGKTHFVLAPCPTFLQFACSLLRLFFLSTIDYPPTQFISYSLVSTFLQ